MSERWARWRWRQWPFGVHLALTFMLLAGVSLAVATWYTTTRMQQTLASQIGTHLQSRAEDLNALVALYLGEKVAELRAIAMVGPVIQSVHERNARYPDDLEAIRREIVSRDADWIREAGDGPLIREITSADPAVNPAAYQLRGFLDAFAVHTEVLVTDQYGGTVAATGPLTDYDQSDEAWWQEAWYDGAGRVYMSKPAYDESAGVTATLIAVPIVDPVEGRTIGILRSTLNIDAILQILGTLRPGKSGFAILADASGPLYYPGEASDRAGEDIHLPTLLASRTNRVGYWVNDAALYAYAELRDSNFNFGSGAAPDAETVESVDRLDLITVVRQDSAEALAAVDAAHATARAAVLIAVAVSLLTAVLASLFITRPLHRLTTAVKAMEQGHLDEPLPKVYSGELNQLMESFAHMAARLQAVIDSLGTQSSNLVDSSTALAREVAERKRAESELMAYRDQLERRVEERSRDLETAQRELSRKERLSAIGRLTERLAREIRSPLGTVSATLYLIQQSNSVSVDERLKSAVERAARAVKRCDRIVNELFAYADFAELQPRDTDLDAWLDGVLAAITTPPDVNLSRRFTAGTHVAVDRDQLRAAVESILANAFDAVQNSGAGCGSVEVGTRGLSERVEIQIADNGPGIAPELVGSVLEPLFGTREGGVGLGLSRAQLIMEEHAGGLEFRSDPATGTTVTLWLPRVSAYDPNSGQTDRTVEREQDSGG